ncbi:MAG TPA: ferric reductase-like transmembrane domain-containing protein [Polyangiales bacterium]|nr:ferric reductase-like transmembrane domain-containing protein [Polyangiales bacterium]
MNLALVTIARYGGWAALLLLAGALCATPLSRVVPRAARVRRPLGICAATLALVHTTFALGAVGVSPLLVWNWPHLRAGALAALVLLALLVTSFPDAVRALRLRAWKALHRLAYLAFLLAILHVLLAPFASTSAALALLAFSVLFGLARALPRRAAQTNADTPEARQNASSTPA